MSGLNRSATRLTLGAISLRISSHFPPIDGSKLVRPVMLPPGFAKLATKPSPIGSETCTKTIGIEAVSGRRTAKVGVLVAKRMSGDFPTSSLANARIRSTSPAAQRYSSCRLRPSSHPSSWSCSKNALRLACHSGSLSALTVSTPIRFARSVCCARAASGQAAAPPSSEMNSRRLIIQSPRQRGRAGSAVRRGRAPSRWSD